MTRNACCLVWGLGTLASDRRRAHGRARTRLTGWYACRVRCRLSEWAPSGAGITTGHATLFCASLVCAGGVPAPSWRVPVYLVGVFGVSPPLAASQRGFMCFLRCGVFPAASPAPFTCDVATLLGHLRMFAPTCVER